MIDKKMIGILASAGLIGTIATYHGIMVRHYTIKSDKLRPKQRFRIALVADLHSHIFGHNQKPLLQKIRQNSPDAVLLAGDIYDNRTSPKGAWMLLEGLQDFPVWYTPGNHEYRVGNFDKVLKLFHRYKVQVLADRWVYAEIGGVPVTLAGADDPERVLWLDTAYQHEKVQAAAFSNLPQERFSILLAHKPEHIEIYKKFGFDLVLSGHAHGGQVRIPGLCNGLFAPGQGIFPQYPGGRYIHGNLTHIVSRGLAVRWYLPRVWNPPELVFIDIMGGKG